MYVIVPTKEYLDYLLDIAIANPFIVVLGLMGVVVLMAKGSIAAIQFINEKLDVKDN